MVQIDLFLSYGLSSGLAIAAKKRIKSEPSIWLNRYTLATLLWLALLFVPQVCYLLWKFPAWETMFVARDHGDIPAWLVAALPAAMVILGLAGFLVTAHFLRAGKLLAAWLQVIVTVAVSVFLVTYGWDGTGYQRLLYAGDGGDWAAGKVFSLGDFLSGDVFMSLIVLQSLLLIPYVFFLWRWSRGTEGGAA
jgi:hypothetical protein